ncbi:lipid II:glycine glycyltransferase FemX [Arsenicicoccus dermatophilus]|uniref:lipid II:glycine glycyltransferase FemX n=1 Tax=Arsenicicoccus dermatophilus TaxID=1076331 RepID=UPI001F4CC537|nr:peptidoglycan bridge formation glycyltransferase FemA/FemB family protein [Arsenicicoccus dermatophilus]MCH8613846.1 aminoacyltransferase [Arsenicicoccus dermatophilus]
MTEPLRIVSLSTEGLDQGVAARSGSFLQLSSWAALKTEWQGERIAWLDGNDHVQGVGLILHRRLPKVGRSLAYLPEGPVLPWDEVAADPERWLAPLVEHARRAGAFTLRVGIPATARSWEPGTVKAALADESQTSLYDVPADRHDPHGERIVSWLANHGWRRADVGPGFAAGQPRLTAGLPLVGQTEEALLKGMNQQWRRNIKAATKAGVQVRLATPETLREDISAFHRVYVETAARDGFTPRPESYFHRMADLMGEPGSPARFELALGELDGELLAATINITVADHCWYLYGASTTARREARAMNGTQWFGIRRALEEGCTVYDMRGITDEIAEGNPHAGLVRFKISVGCDVHERVGEWDLPINKVLHKAFQIYLERRG